MPAKLPKERSRKDARATGARPSLVRRVVNRIKRDNENGARQAVIEDLFFDFHRSRRQVYWMNFWRGFFFGMGSLVGVTVLIMVSAWLLGRFADIFPALADFLNQLIDTMQRRR